MAEAPHDTGTVRDLLALERLEARIVEARFRHPGALSRREYHQLRYALGFARLTRFQPGAAAAGGRTDRPDAHVAEGTVRAFRRRLLDQLEGPIDSQRNPARRLQAARAVLPAIRQPLRRSRAAVIEHHANEFSPGELDEEVGIRALVNVAGGGGGAAYVYIGAYDVLQQAGLVPAYVIGASMGAVIGLFRCLRWYGDFDAYVEMAKALSFDTLFHLGSQVRRYGFPGLMTLNLRQAVGGVFTTDDGRPFRLPDLEIPYEAIVAGVRQSAFGGSPEEYVRTHHLIGSDHLGWFAFRARLAIQLARLVEFFNPRIANEIRIGGDDLTASFDAVDAAGFSAAIPGILHYDVYRDDPNAERILDELLRREDIVGFVDGGVANNVPARAAWYQVQRGKIGTRNAFVLAFDCFHPQWDPQHIWLQPIARMVQLQVAANRPYAGRLIRFRPTLSPAALLPGPRQLDRAVAWGRSQMADDLPLLKKFVEPVEWIE